MLRVRTRFYANILFALFFFTKVSRHYFVKRKVEHSLLGICITFFRNVVAYLNVLHFFILIYLLL